MTAKYLIVALVLSSTYSIKAQNVWSLEDCLRHAAESNLTIRKAHVNEQTVAEDLANARSSLLPSLSFSTTQSIAYRPFQEVGAAMVNDGKATATSSELTQNGTYGLNAQWTIWNGGQNIGRVKQQKTLLEMQALATATQLCTIEERILQYFVQIQYQAEAVDVCEKICETSAKQYERGKAMYDAGKISRVDLTQLEAQLASARYDVVSAQTQVEATKRLMKELLQIGIDQPFDIVSSPIPDDKAEHIVPSLIDVYMMALSSRPEIQNAEKSLELSDLRILTAKGAYWPTIGLQAGIGTSHYTGSRNDWGEQMKTNLNASVGINISVPIFDNRSARTAINKARLNKTTAQYDLEEQRSTLSSTIENIYLQAKSNQQKFLAARVREESQQASYELLNEQFTCGLKNIVELLQGRDRVLQASQEKLQSKYNTILSIALLHFYAGEGINL